jgi:hypothetical protein
MLTIALFEPADATTVDFETLTGPSTFGAVAAPGAQTVVEDIASFAGGVILDETANLPVNQTTVYGTAWFTNPLPQFTNPMTNPLTITFSSPITNFFLDVISSQFINYTLADNAGHSATFALTANTLTGATRIGFAATGTVVTLFADSPFWDFLIDNVHFNEALPADLQAATPLPAALPLFATGLGALGLLGWRTKRKTSLAA